MAGETCAGCTTTYAVGAARCPQCGSTDRVDDPGGSVLPTVTVACGNDVCRYAGKERRVYLRTAALGVLELPPLVCAGCGLHMPTVTPWPPLTDSEDEQMAKITVHGGASNAAEDVPDAEGGEDVSAGNSSETSSEKPENSPEPSETPSPSPAPTTASRSKKARTGSSSAGGTDGGQTAGTSETGSADN